MIDILKDGGINWKVILHWYLLTCGIGFQVLAGYLIVITFGILGSVLFLIMMLCMVLYFKVRGSVK